MEQTKEYPFYTPDNPRDNHEAIFSRFNTLKVYDIESVKNVFTNAYLDMTERTITFVMHFEGDANLEAQYEKDPEGFIAYIDEYIYRDYARVYDEYGLTRKYMMMPEFLQMMADELRTTDQYADSYEKRRGQMSRWMAFNSKGYDTAMLAVILETYISSGDGKVTPLPEYIREMSDRLIRHRKVSDFLNDNVVGDNIKRRYYQLTGTSQMLDVMLLNEYNKFIGLKKISANKGYRIKESKKLSGHDITINTLEELAELLAYNAVDIINLMQMMLEPEYLVPYKNKQLLTERFEKEYRAELPADSTNANFVEHLLAPKKRNRADEIKFLDDTVINYYYPTYQEDNWVLRFALEQAREAVSRETERIQESMKPHDPESYILTNDQFKLTEDAGRRAFEGFVRKQDTYLRHKPMVKNGISRYRFNLKQVGPDGKQGTIEEDLLEMMNDEVSFPEEVYRMYDAMRGQKSAEAAHQHIIEHDRKASEAGQPTILPQDGRKKIYLHAGVMDSNSYITYGSGGGHGEYYDRESALKLYKEELKKREEVEVFNRSLLKVQEYYGFDDDAPKRFVADVRNGDNESFLKTVGVESEKDYRRFATGTLKKNNFTWKKQKHAKKGLAVWDNIVKASGRTVHAVNAGHADVGSMYPSIIINLGIFIVRDEMTGEFIHTYKDMRDERILLKNSLPKDFSEWTAEDVFNNQVQDNNKLWLNSGSGLIDTPYDHKVLMNNAALRMRICGQMILAYFVYKATEKGALCTSINTDGVYHSHISAEDVKPINEEWCRRFYIEAEPELIPKFISKDSNNRFESLDDKTTIISAKGAELLYYKGPNLTKNPVKPHIVDYGLVKLFLDEDMPLEAFDREKVKGYLQDYIDKVMAYDYDHTIPEEELKRNKKDLEKDQVFMSRNHAKLMFQWVFAMGSGSVTIPVDINTKMRTEPGSVFRGFLMKEETNVRIWKFVSRKDKKENAEAREIAVKNNLFDEESLKKNITFEKVTNLNPDVPIEIHNDDVYDIPDDILTRLDLDAYVDIIYDKWLIWSEKHVVLRD